jgi:toxin CcdB
MARFDVYRYRNAASQLVVDVQANLLQHLETRFVIPLAPRSTTRKEELQRLKPTITVATAQYVLLTTEMGAVSTTRLGERVANVEAAHGYDITAALDFLFQGF